MFARTAQALLGLAVVLASACASGNGAMRTTSQTDIKTLEAQDNALAGARRELSLHPTAEAHRRVAAEFVRLHVLDQAYDEFTAAIKKDSRDAAAYDGRARIWREWSMPRRALDDANRAVLLAPQSAEAHNTLGTILYAMGIPADAELEFTKALALDPKAAYAANNLCYLAFMNGETDRAEANCRLALDLAPELDAAHQNMALVYAATDISRAEKELAAGGDAGRARYNLGILHLARREYQQAAAAFELACSERPAVRDACQRAEQARTLAKVK